MTTLVCYKTLLHCIKYPGLVGKISIVEDPTLRRGLALPALTLLAFEISKLKRFS